MNQILIQRSAKITILAIFLLIGPQLSMVGVQAKETKTGGPPEATPDLEIETASVQFIQDLSIMVFEIQVKGKRIAMPPEPRGQLDEAPVLAYVFATNLKASTVGFGDVEGTLALAVTSHPDFDDTPLWDENSDGTFDNDGRVYHSHWVLLVPDDRVAGGLSVRQFNADEKNIVLPPTNPGMPIYLDSPGFPVVVKNNRLRVSVPAFRIRHHTDFKFDVVTSYLQVNTSDDSMPMLGVYKVYHVLSGDLSLPYRVEMK